MYDFGHFSQSVTIETGVCNRKVEMDVIPFDKRRAKEQFQAVKELASEKAMSQFGLIFKFTDKDSLTNLSKFLDEKNIELGCCPVVFVGSYKDQATMEATRSKWQDFWRLHEKDDCCILFEAVGMEDEDLFSTVLDMLVRFMFYNCAVFL